MKTTYWAIYTTKNEPWLRWDDMGHGWTPAIFTSKRTASALRKTWIKNGNHPDDVRLVRVCVQEAA